MEPWTTDLGGRRIEYGVDSHGSLWSTVVLSESGPCVINGSTFTALSAGQCTVTATSPGSATVTPDTNNYTVTVTAPPKKSKKKSKKKGR